MADNPTLPWLDGPVAADQVGGVYVPRTKIQIGGDGSATDIAGDAVDGIRVRVSMVDDPVIVDPIAIGAAAVALVTADIAVKNIAVANANRRKLLVYNNSNQPMLLKYGAGAAAALFTVRIPSMGYWEMPQPIFTGVVTGIWEGAAPTSGAMVTEG